MARTTRRDWPKYRSNRIGLMLHGRYIAGSIKTYDQQTGFTTYAERLSADDFGVLTDVDQSNQFDVNIITGVTP